MVVPLAPGGPTDLAGRAIAEALSNRLGQSVVVENKTGGGGVLGAGIVKDAAADGYTALTASSSVAIDQILSVQPRVHVLEDFEIVGIPLEGEMGIYAHPGTGFKTLVDLVEFAKANPGKLRYSSAGAGTATHLEFERFKYANKLDVKHIPYKGGSEQMTGTISGQVELLIFDTGVAKSHVDGGKLVVLGTGGREPSRYYKGVPTIGQALDQPDYTSTYWIGVFLPKGTDAAIVQKYRNALEESLETEDVAKRLSGIGFNIIKDSAKSASERIERELGEMNVVVKAADIQKR